MKNGELARLLLNFAIGLGKVREKVSVQIIEHCGVFSEVDCLFSGESADDAVFGLKLTNVGRMGLLLDVRDPLRYWELITDKLVQVLTEAQRWGKVAMVQEFYALLTNFCHTLLMKLLVDFDIW